ncbi:MAG: FAD-dependent oxidoreductase [Actinomycetes bacterium]
MVFTHVARPHVLPSLADVKEVPYWLDDVDAPTDNPRVVGALSADLLIVGGGFTGLWAAIDARTNHPDLDVVLVEGDAIAHGASGRNGGFVAASLTHGFANGLDRWPDDIHQLVKLGQQNLNEMEAFVSEHKIDCDWLRVGEMDVATEDYQVEALQEYVDIARPYGEELSWLNQDETRARLNSPTYKGALFDPDSVAICDPARLAWGLRDVALSLGVRIFEHSKVEWIDDNSKSVTAHTALGTVTAPRVLLATNAYPPLLRRLKYLIVPVYDSVLVTQPLDAQQKSDIGWSGSEGISDAGNQFHYYRPTVDGRILWGGFDATYHYRSGFGPQHEHSMKSWPKLADHFFTTFPQLEGLKFEYAWSGAIDTCTRFSAFWGSAMDGKLVYVAGYTGLGVGASRFGAQVSLDKLLNRDTERSRLEMVNTLPTPFPPEPLRAAGINFTRWSLNRADNNGGKRNLWLRTLDRLGMGFDS